MTATDTDIHALSDELTEVSKQMHTHIAAVDAFRIRRNAIIRQLHSQGVSERKLAKLTGITPASINEIRHRG